MTFLRLLLALAGLAALGCTEAGSDPVYQAPAESRVALVLEPPVVAVGEVTSLDLSVVTAPGTTLRPFELPGSVDGFFVVERQPTETIREAQRWIHRTRVRLRAIEVGSFSFPGGQLEVDAPEGGSAVLHYEALPLEVVSVLSAHPNQGSPYGVRLLPLTRDAGGAGSVVAFGAGALLALASVGLLLLVRRRLARDAAVVAAPPEHEPAWEAARRELSGARATLDADPRAALDAASRALRRYVVARFGGDAHVRTHEELSGAKPPFTLTTRWSRLLALLADLDAERFPPGADAGRAATLLDQVDAFVEETVPGESAA